MVVMGLEKMEELEAEGRRVGKAATAVDDVKLIVRGGVVEGLGVAWLMTATLLVILTTAS